MVKVIYRQPQKNVSPVFLLLWLMFGGPPRHMCSEADFFFSLSSFQFWRLQNLQKCGLLCLASMRIFVV